MPPLSLRPSAPRAAGRAAARALTLAAGLAAGALAGCASGGATPPPQAPITDASAGAMSTTRVSAGSTAGAIEFRTTSDAVAGSKVEVPASAEKVWNALPEVYAGLGISLNTVLSDSKTLGLQSGRLSRRLGKMPLSRYIDCGIDATSLPNADSYAVTLTALSRVNAATPTSSTVVTQVMASARPASTSGSTLACATTGRLEEAINRAALDAAAK